MKIERKTIKFIRREEKFINYEWNHYKTVLIILIFFLTLESYLTGSLQKFFDNLGSYGYIGGFVSGFLYTYSITTPFALAAFFVLAENLNIWLLTISGTLGGLIGEYFIYDFIKKEAGRQIRIGSKKIKMPQIKSRYFKIMSFLMAAVVIATPIPDEFLAILFGIEKCSLRDFLLLTLISKFLGILLIVGLGRIF